MECISFLNVHNVIRVLPNNIINRSNYYDTQYKRMQLHKLQYRFYYTSYLCLLV